MLATQVYFISWNIHEWFNYFLCWLLGSEPFGQSFICSTIYFKVEHWTFDSPWTWGRVKCIWPSCVTTVSQSNTGIFLRTDERYHHTENFITKWFLIKDKFQIFFNTKTSLISWMVFSIFKTETFVWPFVYRSVILHNSLFYLNYLHNTESIIWCGCGAFVSIRLSQQNDWSKSSNSVIKK